MIFLSQLIPPELIDHDQLYATFTEILDLQKEVWLYEFALKHRNVRDASNHRINKIRLLVASPKRSPTDSSCSHMNPSLCRTLVVIITKKGREVIVLTKNETTVLVRLQELCELSPSDKTIILFNGLDFEPGAWGNLKAYNAITEENYCRIRTQIANACHAIISTLPESTPQVNVIELGCAWGQGLMAAMEKVRTLRNVRGHGVDYISRSIERAQQENNDHDDVSFHHKSYNDLAAILAHDVKSLDNSSFNIIISSGGLSVRTLHEPYELVRILQLSYRSNIHAIFLSSISDVPVSTRLARKIGYSMTIETVEIDAYYTLIRVDENELVSAFCKKIIKANKLNPVTHLNLSFHYKPSSYLKALPNKILSELRSIDISCCYIDASENDALQTLFSHQCPLLRLITYKIIERSTEHNFEYQSAFVNRGNAWRENLLALYLHDDVTVGLNIDNLLLQTPTSLLRAKLYGFELASLMLFMKHHNSTITMEAKGYYFTEEDVKILESLQDCHLLIILLLANINYIGYEAVLHDSDEFIPPADCYSNSSTGYFPAMNGDDIDLALGCRRVLVRNYQREAEYYHAYYQRGGLTKSAFQALAASRMTFFKSQMATIDCEESAEQAASYSSLEKVCDYYQKSALLHNSPVVAGNHHSPVVAGNHHSPVLARSHHSPVVARSEATKQSSSCLKVS